ncbi:hypothetical protein ABW19_dt0201291 [Dactylella cylindrospora]|nr:hypothetical protein ABW19_dt0201291 [Dactylella cylindrospora]
MASIRNDIFCWFSLLILNLFASTNAIHVPRDAYPAPDLVQRDDGFPARTTVTTNIDGSDITYTVYSVPTIYDFPAIATISGTVDGTLTAIETVYQIPSEYIDPPEGAFDGSSSSVLSKGAIAGIAVGISIVVLGSIAFFFWRAMKNRKVYKDHKDINNRNATSVDYSGRDNMELGNLPPRYQ